jgi:MFS superfamily sulfate permease-like transporter
MTRTNLINDFKASIVVFLVALPLCLGIALASGAPPASGIIAGIIGGIIVGLFSNSEISVSGPAAGLTVIVLNGIATAGSFETFTTVIVIAGIFQVLFSFIKGGIIGDFFPTAVIKGMLAAIGLILIMKQFGVALGLSSGPLNLSEVLIGPVIISLVSLLLMLSWEKAAGRGLQFFKLVPGPVVAVGLTIVLNNVFHLVPDTMLVKIPASLGQLAFPDFTKVNGNLIQLALTIAVIASLETLLCIDASDKLDSLNRKTNKNRELFAQGLGNSISGLLGGLPLTAVIVRTSTNVAAGAHSKLSAIFHGFWLLLSVLFISNVLNQIPLPTLACILLLVGYKLTKPAFYSEMWNRGKDHFIIFVSTIGLILATDLLKGIFAGLVVAILFEITKASWTCLEVIIESDKAHIKFVKHVSFFHKAALSKQLAMSLDKKSIHIYGMNNVKVHADIKELLLDFDVEARKKNIQVVFER